MTNRRFGNLLQTTALLLWTTCPAERAIRAGDVEPNRDYGTISGQFVFEGTVPARRVLHAKGAAVNDPAICAAGEMLSDELLVDADSGGVANVFIFLPKAAKVHPALKASAVKEVVFDQQGCRFVPHALFARTDQTIVVKSNDACAHNTRMVAGRNQPFNFALTPNDRMGTSLRLKVPERRPIPIECSIHTWMKAHWLILDHPYASVSDQQGRFTIADLPAGEHAFWIWHELKGDFDKAYKLTVKGGQKIDLGKIRMPAVKLVGKK